MAKLQQTLDTAALRTGNTIATPLRRGGEVGNALANIMRQSKSSAKNAAEVGKQTVDALVDNFLNFSKVEGKRYQKLIKGSINLASAVTRRPAMIAGAGVLSGINQSMREPFKKLLYTPKTMFKGIGNATRIFSKKKGFDFQKYDTHETGTDTRISKITQKRIGFFGKGGASESTKSETKKSEKKKEEAKPKPEPAQPEIKRSENKQPETKQEKPKEVALERGSKERVQKMEEEKNDKAVDEYLAEMGYPPGEKFGSGKVATATKPKSIDEIKDNLQKEALQKDETEKSGKLRKNLHEDFKKQYTKEYNKTLKGTPTKEGVVARGKEAKLGENPEEIVKNLQEKDPTFAGYIEDEILHKAA